MANEPIYSVASMDHKNKLCSAQTVVETRILPMAGVSISKVLTYSADGSVETTDVFTGEARVTGKITFRVMFLDGEGNCRCAEALTEFTDKIASDAIGGSKPQIISRILDTDIINVQSDEIKLAAIVEMDLFDNISTRVKYLQTGGDDVYASDSNVEYLRLISKSSEVFSLSAELDVEGDKILLAESRVIALSQTAGTDSVTVEGEIISNIITEIDGAIHNYKLITPFVNQCACEGSRSETFADAAVRLAKSSAVLVMDQDSSAINLEFEVEATAYVYTQDILTPVSDAFSITNELALTTAELALNKNRHCKTVFERVEGSVTLDNDMPVADTVLATASSKLNLANTYITGDRLILEGTVTSSVIYFSAETKSKNSLAIELPFSITTSERMEGSVIWAYGEVKDITAKIRRGNEIDIKAEIAVSVGVIETETLRVITDISLGDKIEIPAAAISLHIGRAKETLWDVAKSLKTTPELIMLQNPDLNLPLSGGERVIVYRHLKKS